MLSQILHLPCALFLTFFFPRLTFSDVLTFPSIFTLFHKVLKITLPAFFAFIAILEINHIYYRYFAMDLVPCGQLKLPGLFLRASVDQFTIFEKRMIRTILKGGNEVRIRAKGPSPIYSSWNANSLGYSVYT